MKYNKLDLGTIEAIANILGGMRNIELLLSGEVKVTLKIKKQILKSGLLYKECKNFFEKLPDELPIPKAVIYQRAVYQKLKVKKGPTYFSKDESFGLACKLLKEEKECVIFFEEENDLYEIELFHGLRGWEVIVSKLPSFEIV